jgi:hypothetical protein
MHDYLTCDDLVRALHIVASAYVATTDPCGREVDVRLAVEDYDLLMRMHAHVCGDYDYVWAHGGDAQRYEEVDA